MPLGVCALHSIYNIESEQSTTHDELYFIYQTFDKRVAKNNNNFYFE